jgi:hypothetical protein
MVTAAILGFEEQKRKINSRIAELRAMLAPPAEGITATTAPRRKRRVSAAARRAMAEAQRRRWAAVSAAKK